jgi:phosphoribosyl 1,2-cyclic phosphodiesterase
MHPPIRIRILASGSQGNAAIVSLRPRDDAPTHLIIDLGLSPRKLCGALAVENIKPHEIAAILITHADADHLHGGWARRWPFENAKVIARNAHHRAIANAGIQPSHMLDADADPHAFSAQIKAFALPHDKSGSTGFRISTDGVAMGWATDLGRMSGDALAFFAGVDALCIESNYDARMQQHSSRPDFLKERIMGGHGHLSNVEAMQAVLHIHGKRALRHIVLLHLSSQCNSQDLVRELWNTHAPEIAGDMQVATQTLSLPWLSVGQPRHGNWSESLFAEQY